MLIFSIHEYGMSLHFLGLFSFISICSFQQTYPIYGFKMLYLIFVYYKYYLLLA